MGWSSKRNGDLLRLMVAEHFVAFLTVDQNLQFQQNLQTFGVGVVVAVARTNRIKELRPLVSEILEALASLKPGEVIRVDEFAMRCWTRGELESGLGPAAFGEVACFGAYDAAVSAGSTDRLVVVAQRQKTAA